jgi:hypothetical protein
MKYDYRIELPEGKKKLADLSIEELREARDQFARWQTQQPREVKQAGGDFAGAFGCLIRENHTGDRGKAIATLSAGFHYEIKEKKGGHRDGTGARASQQQSQAQR